MNSPQINNAAVVLVLVVHLAWILWVIFGAFWTRGRRWLAAFHIAISGVGNYGRGGTLAVSTDHGGRFFSAACRAGFDRREFPAALH